MNNKKGSLYKSFYYAFCGIISNVLTERNLKIHISLMLLVIICGFLFEISLFEWLVCLVLFGLVISLELVNTAVEITIDIYVDKFNEKAKIAKDTAAGAVLVAAIVSVIVGLIIFVPKILTLLEAL